MRTIIFSLVFVISYLGLTGNYHSQYLKLEEYLIQYEKIAEHGGWPTIKYFKTFKLGQVDHRIALLKKRLIITGELTDSASFNDTFDLKLENAVKMFQETHNLTANGIIDQYTLREMNVPVAYRILQIKANMNRAENFENPRGIWIKVNIASQRLFLIVGDSTMLEMKIIVGRITRKTPVFNAVLTTVEFNPFWIIPPGITRKDILPKIKKNDGFIAANEIKVYSGNKEINPNSVNWQEVDSDNCPYTFIQSPGAKNPLGVIRFSFPNKYFVYMHDTPDSKLFERPNRTFSSGCIRLANARELGHYILKTEKGWSREGIDSLISTRKNLKVDITNPISLKIIYCTAWVDQRGVLNFARDIYRKDF